MACSLYHIGIINENTRRMTLPQGILHGTERPVRVANAA